jgi:hypothetical protein
MALSRVPAHSAAGGFSTLVALIPWKLAEAAGLGEDVGALLGGVVLAVLAVLAWSLREAPWVRQRNYPLSALRGEVFSLSQYLRDFAGFSLLMLLVYGGLWIALAYALQA